jgi:hypothetical protein
MADVGADGVLDKTSKLKELAAEVRRLASAGDEDES